MVLRHGKNKDRANASSDPGGREAARLAELELLGAVRPEADHVLQELVDDAREAFGVGLCMANLITGDAQYFRAWSGELPAELAEARQGPRERSMCRHVVETQGPLVVEDLLASERFGDRHLRVRYGVRFYAGSPLITSDGHAIGSLCLLDFRPREFGERDLATLRAFAGAVVGRLETLGALTRERAAREDLQRLNEDLERRVAQRTERLQEVVSRSQENERMLRESEERFRTVVESLGEGLLMADLDDIVLYANARVTEFTGYAAEELIGRPSYELLLPPERWEVARRRHDERAKGLSERYEMRLLRKDGTTFWTEVNASPYRDAAGEIVGTLGAFTDVTERKRAEEALRESERRYATLLSNAPAYVYRCLNEPGWPDVFCSDYALELTGYSPEEFVGGEVDYGELIVEGDRERVWGEVQAALEKRERYKLRYAIRRRDGALRRVEEFGRGVYDEDGEVVVALEGLIYDVTGREEAAEKLREAERRYRSLVENIPAITYTQDAGHTSSSTYLSPQVKDVLGFTPEESLSDPEHWVKLLHPDDKRRVLAEDRRTNETGEPFSMEYRQIHKDGRVVWLRDEAVLVRDEEGKPLYWQGVQLDITERKALEEELAHRATHDPLTGLANRELLADRTSRALRLSERRGGPVCLLYLDLDGFKEVNDRHGHEAGDALLAAAAARVERCLRPSDTAARIGGDEFAVLLEGVGAERAREVARRIEGTLEAPFAVGGKEVRVGASVGMACAGPGKTDAAELLRKADGEMYRAKRRRR